MNPFMQLFHGPNAGYILELVEQYARDPLSVPAESRAMVAAIIETMTAATATNGAGAPPGESAVPRAASTESRDAAKVMGAVNLAHAIREYGHLQARIDPLGTPVPGDPALDAGYHGIEEADLQGLPAHIVGGPVSQTTTTAAEAIAALRGVYSGSIGYDYDHIRMAEEREWLRHAAESRQFHPTNFAYDPVALLKRLTEVETFELFLHRIFPGKTRFSVEGVDMMVPILDELIGGAALAGIYAIQLGMAHRGRLNVLAHNLHKPYKHILAEFKDPVRVGTTARDYVGWTGDVKYHAGALRAIDYDNNETIDLVVSMAPNPSHLEHVNPVVQGMARAAGTAVDAPGEPVFNLSATLPIVIHGDAAFPGQGIVAETLNLHQLRGYHTGGTIHIIANNQVGFTTLWQQSRSTLYASDLAKGFKIPIVHVNADDPEACLEVARLALAFRQKFQKDFLIDLVGYRRYGHNEGDEPRFTQPMMYQLVDSHATVRQLWGERLVADGRLPANEAEAMVQKQMALLQEVYESLKPTDLQEPHLETPPPGAAKRVQTAVPAEQLRILNRAMLQMPSGFTIHPKLSRSIKRRETMLDNLDEAVIDWGTAENLAIATILADGIPVRLTGEDVERGTFSHRHAVFNDAHNGAKYTPLQAIPQVRAAFEVFNSCLSENAAIGFEYGYNIQAPERLVIWEAQYGDFINTAQAIIDEFVVSGYAKWEQTPSLVLLLPHGYEGQGPDHSSGRLERFLQMAAETNMRIVNPTTAGQYFHLLRRQAALLKSDPLPLIVMTPKSLLRHNLAASSLRDLAEGMWQPVIDDSQADKTAVRRLILCSGKVFVDLVSSEMRGKRPSVGIVRVEQLYRFPADELKAILATYPQVEELIWLQEEPKNMGAWEFVKPHLDEVVGGQYPIRYMGRPRRASPSEGSLNWHNRNQAALIAEAFDI